jgi:DNA polymerase
MALKLSGDFETTSRGSLPQIGAHKYARLASTRILCFAYAIEDDEPEIWFPTRQSPPDELIEAARDPELEFRAWNAAFEFNVWNVIAVRHGLPPLGIERFHCTMAQALVWGVPPKLEQAAIALRTNIEKDKEGAKLMRKMMRPRPRKDGSITWWDQDEPELLWRLGEYCAQDVRAERSIGRRLRPMPAEERRLWVLDQRMNNRGLKVDVVAVEKMQTVVDGELLRIGAALAGLTDGEITSPTQTQRLLKYLKAEGVEIDSLDKRVIPLVLKDELHPRHRQILKLYGQGAKSSTAKLRSMMNYLDDDGRIRSLTQYGGAMRTLRWAGRGPQIQNYPRPSKEIDARMAIEHIIWGVDAETLDVVHGNPMDVVSQCLRGAYMPAHGHAFAVCDYSGIEARVVAWLAGQEDALDVFRTGADIYRKAANDVGSTSRDLGKLLVLSCGFGAGPRRVAIIAQNPPYFIELSKEEAIKNVYGWRNANSEIRSLWYEVDDLIRMVLQKRIDDRWMWTSTRKVAFRMATDERLSGSLLMRLPSGRKIVYRNASIDEIINDPDGAADVEAVIRYDGLDWTKKWTRIRSWGGKFVENCLAGSVLILTERGWLRLDHITNERVWDGEAFVVHGGLITKGRRQVVELDGVQLTPDHKVLTTGGWKHAALCEGFDRASVTLPDSNCGCRFDWEAATMARPLRLRSREDHGSSRVHQGQGEVLRMHAMDADWRRKSHAWDEPASGLCGLAIDARSLSATDASSLAELWGARDRGLPRVGHVQSILDGHGANLSTGVDDRARGQHGGVLRSELRVGNIESAGAQHATQQGYRNAVGRDDSGRSRRTIGGAPNDVTVPFEQTSVEVFDLFEAGRNHRFVVAGVDGPIIVSNCTQAVARDLLAGAVLQLDNDDDDLLTTIHDEIIAEPLGTRADARLKEMKAVMGEAPAWAYGLPLKAEGSVMGRYGK